MSLPWYKSASNVSLNLELLGELFQVFEHGLRPEIIISENCMWTLFCNGSCSIYSK